jgi:hypothetical protein
MMVQTLHADLKHAHDNLSRLSRVRAAITTIAGDATQARRTLHDARSRIDDLDVRGKQQVLDALGVTVQVTGYQQCATCAGSGYRPIAPGTGRRWPPSCPQCHRLRTTPEVTVQITAPQVLLALTTQTTDATAAAV